MTTEQYKDDLREIREMMSRSSRFISLSGWSGISAGLTALVSAGIAYFYIFNTSSPTYSRSYYLTEGNSFKILILAAVTLGVALGLGIFFTTKKAKRKGQKVWDVQSKRLVINLAIPLITGAFFCMALWQERLFGYIAPLTLVFYGLALVNASKYTLGDIRSLGILEIALGLIASFYIGYGLVFWAVGFGVLHIVYGILMQKKYGA